MTEAPAERRPWTGLQVALLALALLPPAVLLHAILRLGVDTPYMDQWETAPLFVKLREGTLGLRDLAALQNESRMVLPRMLFLALGTLTDWNCVAEMIPGFVLAAFEALALYRLDRSAPGGCRAGALGRLALASLLLFGPIQYENWFWGHQMVVFVPPACLLGGILVARSGMAFRAKAILAGALAFAATFSFANGMILWLLLPAALLAADAGDAAARRRWAGAWAAAAAATLVLYFAGYSKPGKQPGLDEVLRSPLDAAHYLLALLGSPLGQGLGHTGIEASTAIGAGLLLIFSAAALFLLRRRADGALVARALPALLLGAYALGTAAITTAGRVGYGVPHALSPRYATFAVLLPVSLVPLLTVVLAEAVRSNACCWTEARAAAAGAALATFAVFAHLLASGTGLLRAENWRVRRLEARSALAFLDVAPDETFLRVNAYPDIDALRERARGVDRLGLLRPALVRPETLAAVLSGPPDAATGSFNAAAAAGEHVHCTGRAFLRERAEPPDAILVGVVEGGVPRILALGRATKIRLSSLEPPSADFRRTEGWECDVPRNSIPAGAGPLRAWAYDSVGNRASLLTGVQPVPVR